MDPDSGFDMEKLREKAKRDWLTNEEIQFILRNHDANIISLKIHITPESGSLYLYNKNDTPNFRKDGYEWKKKDKGNAIAETHAKLKIKNKSVLTCCYAHGARNPYLQRRSYCSLNRSDKHIVLVHFLVVENLHRIPTGKSEYLPREDAVKRAEELSLLVTFVQTLLGNEEIQIQCINDTGTNLLSNHEGWNEECQYMIPSLGKMNELDIKNWILEKLLKDKLQSWVSLKSTGKEITDCTLSKKEQGIIHALSGLGYEWALNPVLSLGVGINFRDVRGWTALHWAAHFGREKMVAALIAAGASSCAVTDPTTQDPIGKPPASAAVTSGHKGIAGYLSEDALNCHLYSLKIKETEETMASAAEEAEGYYIKGFLVDDVIAMNAVKNAASFAARIQSAFRAHSSRKNGQIYELSHASRKFFLTSSEGAAVKIQAHVRGYQVRKKFKLLWLVRFLNLVILRWRRKRPGLRGLRTGNEPLDENEEQEILESFRKIKVDAALANSVSAVQSMAECPEARKQYFRMLDSCGPVSKLKSRYVTEASSSSSVINMMDAREYAEALKNIASMNTDVFMELCNDSSPRIV